MEGQPSDEDDDREHLIEQKDNIKAKSTPLRLSSFQIDDDEIRSRFSSRAASAGRVFKLSLNKWYLFAVFVPLFFLILYFTADANNVFATSVFNIKYDYSVNRMREAERHALYLLKKQQLGLLKLFNQTFVNSNNDSSNNISNHDNLMKISSLSTALLDNLHSQISLNNQIQQVLLSSHESSISLGLLGNYNFTDESVEDWSRCRKVDQRLSESRTIEWKPRLNKYLFAICASGQMSNHLICLEKHMFFAAVLNRVLVIPSARVDYEFHRVLDIDHINKCLGRDAVVTFEEFARIRKRHLHIDKFICYFSLPRPCFLDYEHVKKLKSLGVSMNKLEAAWVEDVKKPTNRTMQDVVANFSSDDDVIAIGDMFSADVEKEWVMQPGGPITHKCNTLVEPSRLIRLTAQRFIQTFLGKNFIALHFRRHGFLKFCNAKQPSCFFPVPQAAECINRVVQRANAPVIYLSTDAAESETVLLQALVFNEKTVPLVKRPARNSAEKWDALLYRHRLEGDSQVEAMLDKTICALSSVFVGSSGSTFTEDIMRLRKDWGSASVCDEYLCQSELPNFIAEDD